MAERYEGVYQFVTVDKLVEDGIAVRRFPAVVAIPSHKWRFSDRMLSVFGNKVTITYEYGAYNFYVPQYQVPVICIPNKDIHEMEAFIRICTDSGYMHKCTTRFTDLF